MTESSSKSSHFMHSAASIQELARLLSLRTRRDVFATLGDTRLANDHGHGLDFSELREYTLGDDARHIHWPSAMANGPVTIKQFQEEHDISDIIALDISKSMTTATTKWSLALETACLLCAVSTLFGNGATLLFFSDRTESRLRLQPGQRALSIAAQALADIRPSDIRTDLAGVFHALRNAQRKPARMFVISDLADHDYMPALTHLAFAHDLTLCHIFPSLTDELPPHTTEIEDAERHCRTVVSSDDHTGIQTREQSYLKRIRIDIQHAGAKYLLFTKDVPPITVFRSLYP